MLRLAFYQIQGFLSLLKKLLIISVFAGTFGSGVWVGLLVAESPVYKGAIAANKTKDNFISEVQKFNLFKANKQEKD